MSVSRFVIWVRSGRRAWPIAVALALSACGAQHDQRVIGAWQTPIIPSEWGSNRMTVIYSGDGLFTGRCDFVKSGAIEVHGTYQIRRGVIERSIEGRKEQIHYRVRGDTMYHRIGSEDYTFERLGADNKPKKPSSNVL